MKSKVKKTTRRPAATLLGRIQEKWMLNFGIDEASFSNGNLLKKKLLEVHRDKPSFGEFLMRFFGLRETWKVRMAELSADFDMDELVDELERTPWTDTRFVEVEQDAASDQARVGVFIYQEALEDSGRVYVITVMYEELFPKVYRAELRASASEPEPFLSIATSNGHVALSRQDVRQKWDELDRENIIGLLALHFLNGKKEKLSMRPEEAAKTKSREQFPPPHDPKCDEMIRKVAHGRTKCTLITLPLEIVKPGDYQFSVLFPAPIIRPFMYEIRDGDRPQLLAYWDGKQFVVSDDYAAYLAYRALKVQDVPVVVMGDYPTAIYGEGVVGGPELLPDVTYRPSTLPIEQSECERVLDSRLQNELILERRDPWFSLIFQFHKFLNNPLTKERELHDLLVRGARELAPGAYKVLSEVGLGKTYRMDLAIQLNGDAQRILLVELERANLPIFTKGGAPYAHVTHAMQQVEDWIRFWHEHPGEVPSPLDATIAPSGVVVIGRSKHLSEDEKRRLLSLNANRRVQLITYDDLAERIETYTAWN